MDEDSPFISFPRRGWIEVGGVRMFLVDVKGGFYGMREVMAREVGESNDDLVYQAGYQGCISFMASAMGTGLISPDREGFENGLDTYADAGFGDFEIGELYWRKGWATVRCKDCAEAWAYVENKNLQASPQCNYTRGVLSAFMTETHRKANTGVEQIFTVEGKCMAKGDDECEFYIGTQADLTASGFEPLSPKMSVRQTLERTVSLLRDSNKRLMQTEMQYRRVFDVTFDATVIVNDELEVLNCNRPAEEFLGAGRQEMTGKNILEFIPESKDVSLAEKASEAVKLNTRIDFKTEVTTSDGETKSCKIRVSPLYGDLAIVFQETD